MPRDVLPPELATLGGSGILSLSGEEIMKVLVSVLLASILAGGGVLAQQAAPSQPLGANLFSTAKPTLYLKKLDGDVLVLHPNGSKSTTSEFDRLIQAKPNATDAPTLFKQPEKIAPPSEFDPPRPAWKWPCVGPNCPPIIIFLETGPTPNPLNPTPIPDRPDVIRWRDLELKGVGRDAVFMQELSTL